VVCALEEAAAAQLAVGAQVAAEEPVEEAACSGFLWIVAVIHAPRTAARATARRILKTDLSQEAMRLNTVATGVAALLVTAATDGLGRVLEGIPWISPGSLPAEENQAVNDTLGYIDNGETAPWGGNKWGSSHGNNEGNLPGEPGQGGYSEYYVPPGSGASGAGTRRIVINNGNGNTYYSWNHYGQSGGGPPFVRIR
jgi:guanyl-specific ribonuclease Sa